MHGLDANPFLAARDPSAESADFADWQELTVDVGGLYSAVSNREGSCVIFGARGRGKSAFSRVLQADCRPEQPQSNRLGIPFGRDAFVRMAQEGRQRAGALDGADLLAAALLLVSEAGMGSAALRDSCRRTLGRLPDAAHEAPAAALCRRLIEEAVPAGGPLSPRALVLLVDEVAEAATDLVPAGLTPHRIVAPLFHLLANCSSPRLKVVAFLPAEWEPALAREPWFALDKVYSSHLTWDAQSLADMLDRRLAYYSRSTKRIASFDMLCETDLRTSIHKEISALAEGRPRCALALAEDLIELHCAAEHVAMQISRGTWQRVRDNWRNRLPAFLHAEEQVRRMVEQEQAPPQLRPLPLHVDLESTRVRLGAQPLDVFQQDYRVLAYLYTQQGELCSADSIVLAAWPDAKQGEGVTDEALAQSIRRLRRALAAACPGVEYIENKKGRGYILWPEGKPAPGAPPTARAAGEAG